MEDWDTQLMKAVGDALYRAFIQVWIDVPAAPESDTASRVDGKEGV
jgi:hypothetical protein